ncbi:MAG: hypothetical protein AB4050_14725 [Synechococcus sp.]
MYTVMFEKKAGNGITANLVYPKCRDRRMGDALMKSSVHLLSKRLAGKAIE